jgi:hypothetical protein
MVAVVETTMTRMGEEEAQEVCVYCCCLLLLLLLLRVLSLLTGFAGCGSGLGGCGRGGRASSS